MKPSTNTETSTRRSRGGGWVLVAALALFAGGCGIFGLGGDGTDGSESKSSDDGPSETPSPDAGGPQVEAESEGDSPDTGEPSVPSVLGPRGDAGGGPSRNPFAPQVEVDDDDEQRDTGVKPRKLGPLKKYPVGEYSLVAILSEIAVPKAMFIAPDGKGYMVKESEGLGKEGGIVRDVRSNAVEIEVPRADEDSESRTMTLKLREEQLTSEDDSELSQRERETLERLMQSEEGREAVEESFEKSAPAANTAEGENEGQRGRRSGESQNQTGEAPAE